MSAFARQLRGRMELAANDRGGVTARLVFPNPTAQDPDAGRTRARPRGNRAIA